MNWSSIGKKKEGKKVIQIIVRLVKQVNTVARVTVFGNWFLALVWKESTCGEHIIKSNAFFCSFALSHFARMSVGKLQPPVIPFMPLLLKDMTFAHEGNKTSLDGLVNFEKMHMMAQTMRAVRFCRSRHLGKGRLVVVSPFKTHTHILMHVLLPFLFLVLDPPSPKNENEIRNYIRCFRTIDNQRVLNSMSQKVEPRRS